MSKEQDSLNNKLSKAKKSAHNMMNKSEIQDSSAVEVAKTHSPKDIALWLMAFTALIGATLANYKLAGIWQPANDIWVKVSVIVALIVFAFICLALTHQGRAFKVLVKDAGIELRRVTWPSKNETIQYTWQTLLVIGIVAFIVWLLDNFFNWFVSLFIG